MIFSRFFKPNFNDPDPKIRQKAISGLDPATPNDKQKLHELAFNDADAGVSIAALGKLDSFALWVKMSQIASDTRIRKASEKKVMERLISPELSQGERHATVMSSGHKPFIRFALDNPGLCGLSTKDILALLAKLDDPAYQRQLLLSTESADLQLQLIQQIEELPQLQKWLKKPLLPTTLQWLQEEVTARQTLAARPLQLQQKITLALSKLNALADSSDYRKILDNQHTLETEFGSLNAELDGLDQAMAAINQEKYSAIQTRVAHVSERLKPAYEIEQEKLKLDEEARKWREQVESAVKDADQVIQQSFIDSNQSNGLVQCMSQLSSLIAQAEVQLANRLTPVSVPLKSAQSRLQALQQLPALLSLSKDINTAVEQFTATYTLPVSYLDIDQAQQVFNAIDKQVTSLLNAAPEQLPEINIAAWTATKREWKQKLSALSKQAQQHSLAVDKKINAVNGMVKQGRFKAAFAVFTKTKRLYEQLPLSLQSRLQRAYQNVHEQITELEDWQEYIAQPRKPELLEEVRALTEQTENIDISQRNSDVNRLRKTWISFGRLDTPEDDLLNEQFDQAIEIAFAPCRHHFAEQQMQRENNAKLAIEIIASLEACASIEDDAVFAKTFTGLTKQWNNLGQIERASWQQLKQQFKDVSQPLKNRHMAQMKANAAAKQQLVEHAQNIALTLPPNSSESVKLLQAQWKSIGFAGKSQDNQLWQAFKQANDAVFSKIRDKRAETKLQSKKVCEQLNEQFNLIDKSLTQAKTAHELNGIKAELKELDQSLVDHFQQNRLDKPQYDRLLLVLQQLNAAIEQQQSGLNRTLLLQQVDETFEYLSSRIGEPVLITEDAPKLLPSNASSNGVVKTNRSALTIRLEILAGAESPDDDDELRRQIQMEVMASKLQAGDIDSADQLLFDWVAQGPIVEGERELLNRLANAYKLAVSATELSD